MSVRSVALCSVWVLATFAIFTLVGDAQNTDFPPSYDLQVSPSEALMPSEAGGGNSLTLGGFDLKGVFSRVYNIGVNHIQVPASMDDCKHYDFSMTVPDDENTDQIEARFRQKILDHFALSVVRASQLLDVYVVTAPHRKPPKEVASKADEMASVNQSAYGIEQNDGDGSPAMAALKEFSINAVDAISFNGTVDDFCRFLESRLDRPVVNETNLRGRYEFDAKSSGPGANDFLARLREQTGLVITPAQRTVEILVVKPR
jgi:uncharacterized protein (TIGR03435 family)